jgi:hypothetical protein
MAAAYGEHHGKIAAALGMNNPREAEPLQR